eukprot:CAMPEP_0114986216 /NCGR_PEP_ID=MMETSP0216-20121206/8305_1 /TAXON_ID=223996 /ORGANISM="Protocruzia adherens, Strain Boccale" /LENGTH=546 /DNA_ID=CAMNT_0002348631 /DNA_START=214 /DNA_END=1854 /DNA_ORIENTATION=-
MSIFSPYEPRNNSYVTIENKKILVVIPMSDLGSSPLSSSSRVSHNTANTRPIDPSETLSNLIRTYSAQVGYAHNRPGNRSDEIRVYTEALANYFSFSPDDVEKLVGVSSEQFQAFMENKDDSKEIRDKFKIWVLAELAKMDHDTMTDCILTWKSRNNPVSTRRTAQETAFVIQPRFPGSGNMLASFNWQDLALVRLDLEFKGLAIKESFLYNVKENNPFGEEYFAIRLLQDHKYFGKLNRNEINEYVGLIANTIRTQIDINNNIAHVIRNNSLAAGYGLEGEHLMNIRLDIKHDGYHLRDQFDWDLMCPANSPEEFAILLVNDNELPRSFVILVAQAIREQIYDKGKYIIERLQKEISINNRRYEQKRSQSQEGDATSGTDSQDGFKRPISTVSLENLVLKSPNLRDRLGPCPMVKNTRVGEARHMPRFLKKTYNTQKASQNRNSKMALLNNMNNLFTTAADTFSGNAQTNPAGGDPNNVNQGSNGGVAGAAGMNANSRQGNMQGDASMGSNEESMSGPQDDTKMESSGSFEDPMMSRASGGSYVP